MVLDFHCNITFERTGLLAANLYFSLHYLSFCEGIVKIVGQETAMLSSRKNSLIHLSHTFS